MTVVERVDRGRDNCIPSQVSPVDFDIDLRQTPDPFPASMPTQEITIWTPARVVRAVLLSTLRLPIFVGRRVMPKA
jgi:hypothetical protein